MSDIYSSAGNDSQSNREWWSWENIMDRAPDLGIPNFQRGQVWESGNRIALLESMFHASPCGSIVLWQNNAGQANRDIGIPLLDNAIDDSKRYLWVVDGQQRMRALIEIFNTVYNTENTLAKLHRCTLPENTLEQMIRHAHRRGVQCGAPDNDDSETSGEKECDDYPRGGLLNWYVCIPTIMTLPEFKHSQEAANSCEMLKRWSAEPNVIKYSIFRGFHVKAIDQGGKKTPFNAPGLLPLGLFLVNDIRTTIPNIYSEKEIALKAALDDPCRDGSKQILQERIPWGPLFLTQQSARTWQECIASPGLDLSPLRFVLSNDFRKVLEHIHGVFKREYFAIGHLPKSDHREAIAAYVRINRAGVRVRAEERAMAVLSGHDPNLLKYLAAFLRERDKQVSYGIQDNSLSFDRSALRHTAEKTLGFALWMRVVTRYVVLRLLPKSALRWLSTDSIERWSITDSLEKQSNENHHIEKAAKHATAALLLIDDIMSQELFFDHRMARPGAHAYLPIIEFLSRLPVDDINGIRANRTMPERAYLARLLHITLLSPYLDVEKQNKMVEVIHGPFGEYKDEWRLAGENISIKDLMHCWAEGLCDILIVDKHAPLLELVDRCSNSNQLGQNIENCVNDSKSLQNPTTGWLYAVERRNKAQDFDWKSQAEAGKAAGNKKTGLPARSKDDVGGKATDIPSEGPQPLAAAMNCFNRGWPPEKQHIVPFSDARRISDTGGTRATASPANNIGNLTWLSQCQNGWDYGFSDSWIDIDAAEDCEKENLQARGFMFSDKADGERAIDLYRKLCRSINGKEGGKGDLKKMYDEFCRIRRAWMIDQLKEWLREKTLPSLPESEPCTRK